MNSSLVTLLLLLIGLGAAVALIVGLTQSRYRGRQAWLTAVAAVTVASLAATWPANLRDAVHGVNEQRKLYAGTAEWDARTRCLSEMSRPDLAEALSFVREVMPDDARYRLPASPSPACLVTNLLPREAVRPVDYDPRRDWAIYDVSVPSDVRRGIRWDARLPRSERRYLSHSSTFVLVRPKEVQAR